MLKNYRSTSQIITKHQSSEAFPANVLFPDNNIHSKLRQRTEHLGASNSKLTFGEAKTASKALPQSRNKSLSCSKLKLFEKAHQVGKEQTFQKMPSKQIIKNFTSSASSLQFVQYRRVKKDIKLQQVVEKKLIIEKVVKSMQDESSGPKLTIRRELQQRRQTKQPSSMVTVAVNTQDQFTQSLMPSQLVYSKDFDLQNESKMVGFYRSDEHLKQKTEMSGSAYLDEQSLKSISKELTLSIQQSIKKQREGQYLAKQRELEQKYEEKERQYMAKFKDLENAMQVKLQKERELIIHNIHQQLEQQFDKVKDLRGVRQEQARKVEQKEDNYERKEQRQERRQSFASNRAQNEQKNVVQNIKAVQKQQITQNTRKASNDINHQIIQQIKTVQKKAPPPPIIRIQPSKKQIQPPQQQSKQAKLSKNGSERPKSIFKEVDHSILDEIQQVKLQKNPNKNNNKSNPYNKQQQENPTFDRVDKSFNVQNKLDNSFSSERPPNKKEKQTIPKQIPALNKKDSEQKNKQVPPQPAPPLKRQLSQEQRRNQQQQQRKSNIKAKLKEYTRFDPIMVGIGQVAGFCSKFCKKSKVSWQMPSLLLYRYCLDLFRSYKPTFQQAQRLKLVKKEQLENYKNYDVVMQSNLAKMCKSFQKKMTIPQVYKQLIDSPQIELVRLRPLAIAEARRYVLELSRSVESSADRGDKDVVQCGLRIINSVFAIRTLDGQSVEMLPQKIEEYSKEQTFELFYEWSQSLKQQK